jgi:hypothetical protein
VTPEGFPDRAEVEAKWEAVIDGRLTREEVHDWAEPFVLDERSDDMMVLTALQQLHGFDLTGDRSGDPFKVTHHGPPGQYIRSIEEVAAQLTKWRNRCVEYDADPASYLQRARDAAVRRIAEERSRPD